MILSDRSSPEGLVCELDRRRPLSWRSHRPAWPSEAPGVRSKPADRWAERETAHRGSDGTNVGVGEDADLPRVVDRAALGLVADLEGDGRCVVTGELDACSVSDTPEPSRASSVPVRRLDRESYRVLSKRLWSTYSATSELRMVYGRCQEPVRTGPNTLALRGRPPINHADTG